MDGGNPLFSKGVPQTLEETRHEARRKCEEIVEIDNVDEPSIRKRKENGECFQRFYPFDPDSCYLVDKTSEGVRENSKKSC